MLSVFVAVLLGIRRDTLSIDDITVVFPEFEFVFWISEAVESRLCGRKKPSRGASAGDNLCGDIVK